MSSAICVLNPSRTEFDFSNVRVNSNYNIILHCVYDLVNHFDSELEFLKTTTKNDLVILWHPVEAGVWEQAWMTRLDQVLESVECRLVYLTGCGHQLDLDRHFNYKFDIKFFPVFDIRAQDIWGQYKGFAQPVTVDKIKPYMFINSKDTDHRRYVLGALLKNNLIDLGTVSYQCSEGISNINFNAGVGFTDAQLDTVRNMFDLTQSSIPIKLDDNTVASKLSRNLYLDSYLNIVGETTFINIPFSHTASFVTEKTFNAIANNQMFIVVGQAGNLDLLRSLGYQTFDGIIDETYDTILNNGQRLDAVAKEIVRFVSRPLDAIKQDYQQVQEVITHNRDLLYQQNLQTRLQNFIDQYHR
jgi:hypothetical protein